MNKLRSIFFAISALLCMSCVPDLEVNVEFNEAAYAVAVGDTLNLAAELKVENSVETPKFSTSDNAVAKFLPEGLLVALAPGDAEVTATVAGKSAKTQVKVSVVTAEKILLECPESVYAPMEEWMKVTAKVEPGKFSYDNLVWEFTASDEALGLEYKKVNASEYTFKVAAFVEGAKVEVKVSDKNSDLAQTASIQVLEAEGPAVAAKIIRLSAPEGVTESLDTWGTVTAEVVADGAAEYNYANLEWEFTASHPEETGFAYEKVSDAQYNVSFTTYKAGAYVDVKVTDLVGGKFAIKTIAVKQRPQSGVSSIEVSPASLNLFVEQSVKLALSYSPVDYDPTLFAWESSNTDVVTVNGGIVTAVGEGSATVKVTDTVSGLADECEVTVKVPVTDATVKKIILDSGKLNLRVGGQSHQLVPVCYDEAGNEVQDFAGLVWSAEPAINEYVSYDVVEVSPLGIVTPKAEGFTIVTVAVASNTTVKTTCEVYVKAKEVVVEKLTLSPAERSIKAGQVYTLEVTTEPDLSLVDDKTITFVSNNPEVATVDASGLVKGISNGEAVITATAANGVSATAKVVVSEDAADDVTDFQITLSIDNEPSDENMQLPQFEKLNVKVSYTNGYVPKESRWECSDSKLVKMTIHDGYAELEAIYDGMMDDADRLTVTITHFADERSEKKVIDVVRAMPKSVEFVGLPENNTLYLGESFGPDFRARVYPDQASQEITYWGTDGIASVANGSRPAFKTGYFELNARAHYMGNLVDLGATVYITVKARTVEGGTLSNTALSLQEGESATLEVSFTPANNENYDYSVAWASSDESVVTVKDGKVTAVAEGTATISATLSNGDVLTCAVTVEKAKAATLFVGDFYYSDGTWSTELDPSKTPIGIVFSVDNPAQMGDAKLAADHPEATHGLVVSLTETANILWQTEATNVGQWLADNTGYNDLQNTTRKCGYSNTLGLQAYNAVCEEANKVLVADCAPEVQLGAATSGWYLPSYAELEMLRVVNNAGLVNGQVYAGDISARIVEAGGTPFAAERKNYNYDSSTLDAPSYWSSTEASATSSWAAAVHFLHGGETNKYKHTKTYYIARYIFAF